MTLDPIPAKALGSITSHGESWVGGNGRVGHYRLLGWGLLEAWEDDAACKGAPLELFFGDEAPIGQKSAGRTKRQTQAAKAICKTCPVLNECRKWSLRERVPFGVLGGWTERERLELIEGKPVGPGTRLIRPSS
jgi:WhiB family transcriptional regulator, redox-sensing transcriptional regulator